MPQHHSGSRGTLEMLAEHTTRETSGVDFHKTHVTFPLEFNGFTDIHEVVIEPMRGADDDVQSVETAAISVGEQVAKQLSSGGTINDGRRPEG